MRRRNRQQEGQLFKTGGWWYIRFYDNRVLRNGGAGLVFRDEAEAMGAHRNVFEDNYFLDNGVKGNRGVTRAARTALLKRLRSEPVVTIGRWSRDELYEDKP